ncbi:MAG TPA: hypothetical protein VIK99_03400 [Thermaerobacter sp.]
MAPKEPRLVEYEDCLAIEFGRQSSDEEQVELDFPGFWHKSIELTVCVAGDRVTAVLVPKDTPDEELDELVLLRWSVMPEDRRPWDEYTAFELGSGRVLYARFPRSRNFPRGGLNPELLSPLTLPRNWQMVDEILGRLAAVECLDWNYYSYDQWLYRNRDRIALNRLEREFQILLRQQREAAALLDALGVNLSLRRVDVERAREIFRAQQLDERDPTAWARAASSFPAITGPFITPIGQRKAGRANRAVLTFHSAQAWLEKEAPVDYMLLLVEDRRGEVLGSYAVWLPWTPGEGPDIDEAFELLMSTLSADGLVPETLVAVDHIQPVLVCDCCGLLSQPALEPHPGGRGRSRRNKPYRHGPGPF